MQHVLLTCHFNRNPAAGKFLELQFSHAGLQRFSIFRFPRASNSFYPLRLVMCHGCLLGPDTKLGNIWVLGTLRSLQVTRDSLKTPVSEHPGAWNTPVTWNTGSTLGSLGSRGTLVALDTSCTRSLGTLVTWAGDVLGVRLLPQWVAWSTDSCTPPKTRVAFVLWSLGVTDLRHLELGTLYWLALQSRPYNGPTSRASGQRPRRTLLVGGARVSPSARPAPAYPKDK